MNRQEVESIVYDIRRAYDFIRESLPTGVIPVLVSVTSINGGNGGSEDILIPGDLYDGSTNIIDQIFGTPNSTNEDILDFY